MQTASAESHPRPSDAIAQRIRRLRALSVVARVLNIALLVVLVFLLVVLLFPSLLAIPPWPWLHAAVAAEGRSIERLRSHLHASAGHDMVRVLLIVAVYTLSHLCLVLSMRWADRAQYLRFAGDYEIWKKSLHLADDATVLSPVNQILDQLRTGHLKNRDELLQVFAATKRKLDEIGRDLAFLSVDVVGSTQMKVGEEKAAVEHDFREYKRFVEERLIAHGRLKTAWTPDGTMSCFPTVDAAVAAAKDIIQGLGDFNRDVKTLRHDFAVRCGVHSGYVYFDESRPLEQMTDRVIDIAGHLQKHAASNTVCVAKPIIEPLDERQGFAPAGKTVSGYEVYQWRPAGLPGRELE